MKKRFLSVFLALALCLTLLPTTVLAEAATYTGAVTVAGQSINDGEYLTMDNSGSWTKVTSKPESGYVYYNNGILTLNNISITTTGATQGIYVTQDGVSEHNITLKIEGTNSINSNASGIEMGNLNCTLTGTGTLTVVSSTGNAMGVRSLTINDNVTLNATANGTSGVYGIWVTNNIELTNGTIVAKAEGEPSSGNQNYGIYAGGNVTIGGTANVTAWGSTYGIHCFNASSSTDDIGILTLKGGTLTVGCKTETTHTGSAVNARKIDVSGGNLVINQSKKGLSASETITVSGTANLSISNGRPSLEAPSITVKGGTLNLTSEGNCLSADDSITISGGDITAKTTGNAAALQAKHITVSGGTVKVTANSNAIYSDRSTAPDTSSVTVSGGDITAITNSSVPAIDTGYNNPFNISITGGTVAANGAITNTAEHTTLTINGDAVVYCQSLPTSCTPTKGIIYTGVNVSLNDSGNRVLNGGTGMVYGDPNVPDFAQPVGSSLGIDFATNAVTVTQSDMTYTGSECLPDPVVQVNKYGLNKTLIKGTDYTLVPDSGTDYINAGSKSYKIQAVEGSGNIGTKEFTFNITPKGLAWDISDLTVSKYEDSTTNPATVSGTLKLSGVVPNDDVTLTYDSISASNFSDSAAGDYTVDLTVSNPKLAGADKDNYSLPATTFSFNGAQILPRTGLANDIDVTYGQYTDKEISVTVTEHKGYSYSYQWYNGSKSTITGATDSTYTIPNDLTAGSHYYYCVVTAKRADNNETATIEKKITVTVNRATAAALQTPTAQNTITYGATLSTVGLPDGWTWADGITVPTVTNSGYVAYFTPADTANYDWTAVDGWNASENRVERTVAVTVNKAEQNAPTGISGTAETIDGKADGKITGVTSAMEYRKDGDTTYTAIAGTEITNRSDGKYYVRYKADGNHNASADTEVTVSVGRKLTVSVLPNTQVGYTLTVDKTEFAWNENVTLTFKLKEGYSKLKSFAVKVNGTSVTLDSNRQYAVTNAEEDITITVEGVADTLAPTGEIKISDNSLKAFLNNITFGLFFKDTQEVTITATDNSGETVKIEYLLSDKGLTVEELATKTFTSYTGKFNIEPNNEYVIYAKLTDKSDNVAYICSDGIVLDSIAPVISGITNGETYCNVQTVTVSDKYDVTVTVNDKPVTLTNGVFTLSPAEDEQKIVVTDKAGNKTEMTVTVNDGHTGGTADCTHKAICEVCGEPYGEVDNSNQQPRT